jgi:hypothetical protein
MIAACSDSGSYEKQWHFFDPSFVVLFLGICYDMLCRCESESFILRQIKDTRYTNTLSAGLIKQTARKDCSHTQKFVRNCLIYFLYSSCFCFRSVVKQCGAILFHGAASTQRTTKNFHNVLTRFKNYFCDA